MKLRHFKTRHKERYEYTHIKCFNQLRSSINRDPILGQTHGLFAQSTSLPPFTPLHILSLALRL